MNEQHSTLVLTSEVKQQMQISRQRLLHLQESVQNFSHITPQFIEEVVSELAVALEELEVTVEALQQQHNVLLETQNALLEEQQRYEQLFLLAPDGYLVTDVKGNIREVNQNAETLLGLPKDWIQDKPFVVFVPKEQQTLYQQQFKQIREENRNLGIYEWEITLFSRLKGEFPAAITTSVARDGKGNIVSIHWSIRDISDRKAAEAMRCQLDRKQAISDYKSRLIRTVSHELRSPLHVANMATQLLTTRLNTDSKNLKVGMLLQKLQNANNNMVRLLDNILTLSAIETGKAQVVPKSFDLEAVCQELVERYQMYAERNQTLIFEQLGELQDVWLDEELLQRILCNLLSNAMKYSKDNGEVKFRVEARGDRVIFQISDNGIGIPSNSLEQLFEPFYRAENTTAVNGNGLGLSIVKEAATLLGGEIDCESTENIGTTFTVRLPWRYIPDNSA